jgi:hypothetical protein
VKLLSRRTVLRGAVGGTVVSLALPTLDAMLRPSGAQADGASGPFFGLFFWANGTPWHGGHGAETAGHPDLWTPAIVGPGYAPSELLTPLARHTPTVITGLTPHTEVPSDPPGQSDGHMRGFMVAVTGDRPRSEGFDHPSHTLTALRPSIDQVIARDPAFVGSLPTRFRSLHVGVSGARFHEYGHWNAISYNGPGSQNLPITSIAQLYSLLFDVPPDAGETLRRASLLDAVRDDGLALRGRLGASDRARLDEHLENVWEIQRRLELSTGAACTAPGLPGDGDLRARADGMARLLAAAVQCDLTRVFTFMLTSPASVHVFGDLGVPDGMHKVCHDGGWEQVRAITRQQMDIFATVLDRFAELTDAGGGSVLDRGVILGTSEYGEGWKHGVAEMPVLLAGGGCGRLARGVHAREAGGNLAKAHLTALRALGMPQESWGWNGAETPDHVAGIVT